jgi:hypothetical protein
MTTLNLEKIKSKFSLKNNEELISILSKFRDDYDESVILTIESILSERGDSIDKLNVYKSDYFQLLEKRKSTEREDLNKYYGVTGWLLFFCISFGIFFPIGKISIPGQDFALFSKYFDQFTKLKLAADINLFFGFIQAILGFKAGLALYKIKPKAVEQAKKYLLFCLGLSIISLILILWALDYNGEWFYMTGNNLLVQSLFTLVWYSYLNKSKKVKATYNI